MCRNIRTLFNFEPPATELEIRDAALQFVRKLSGFNVPSQANAAAFDHAVAAIAAEARTLIPVAGDDGRAQEPRGRGRQGPRALGRTLRALTHNRRALRSLTSPCA